MSGRLEGKIALITGAAGGIGAASARLFAQEGASLVITDARGPQLSELETELRESSSAVLALRGDLTDERFVEMLFNASADRFHGLNILYNNAGAMVAGSLDTATGTDFSTAIAVNLIAQVMVAKHAARLMRRGNGGSIVNTASMGGLLGYKGMAAYTASKAAIIGATKSMAMELVEDNIRVNAIAPGIVDTQMPQAFLEARAEDDRKEVTEAFFARQLMKRFATPDEIAQAALFLSSDASSFITGIILPVDGGWSAW
jgi:meso-butanediol dehydrogenase/(S,S)-butanediol dehydrogenase/diacetyl reductase